MCTCANESHQMIIETLVKNESKMAQGFPKSIGLILLGGGGSNELSHNFRPLSLDLPKPLFPVAGQEMLAHHIQACAQLPNLAEILLIGSYDEGLFQRFFDQSIKTTNIPIRYLQERRGQLGTGGGMRFFREQIREQQPECLFVLHCDICCSFPLQEMMRFHLSHGGDCTILGKRVFQNEANKYGCLVQDQRSREIVHWAEKPDTFVSDLINCGIYLFQMSILDHAVRVGDQLAEERQQGGAYSSGLKNLFPDFNNPDNLRLEQDVLLPLAGQKKLYLYETGDFWCQIKTPGMAITCSEMYMQRFRYTRPSVLASTGGKLSPRIEGNVIIDPSAEVHPTAKLGPNVCIAAGVKIGPGVRIAHAIILEGVTIKEHACVLFAIIGWNSIIGQWARVEGMPPSTKSMSLTPADAAASARDVTIFGVAVVAKPEIIVRNCIVLPHKSLSKSCHNEILL